MDTIKAWRAEIAAEVDVIEAEAATARQKLAEAEALVGPAEADWAALSATLARAVPKDGWSGFVAGRINEAQKACADVLGRCHVAREAVKQFEERAADRREALGELDRVIAAQNAPLALVPAGPVIPDVPAEAAASEESPIEAFRRLHGQAA